MGVNVFNSHNPSQFKSNYHKNADLKWLKRNSLKQPILIIFSKFPYCKGLAFLLENSLMDALERQKRKWLACFKNCLRYTIYVTPSNQFPLSKTSLPLLQSKSLSYSKMSHYFIFFCTQLYFCLDISEVPGLYPASFRYYMTFM